MTPYPSDGERMTYTPKWRIPQVRELMLQGLLTKQIADRLGLSVATVSEYRKSVLEDAGVRNTAQLMYREILSLRQQLEAA